MALVPTIDCFPGFDATATEITIPLSDLPGLTQTEAANISEMTRSYLEGVVQGVNSLPTAERPTKMTISRGLPASITGQPNQIRITYTASFDVQLPVLDLAVVAE